MKTNAGVLTHEPLLAAQPKPRISDLIAEPEGPTFISSTVTQRLLDRRLLVTQDP
jgi:hypothetical protein